MIGQAEPSAAQELPAAQPTQLPAVTVTSPGIAPPKRAGGPKSSRNREVRKSAVIGSNPSQAAASASIQIGPAASSDGAALQPTAASAMHFSGEQVNAIPFSRPGEALEVVPGLIVTQHSGAGKANQYFLRGFNLDHGTDLAISVDGMPVNMPTHGHGQGYADTNFLIPELIQSVNVRKGPYFADVGDFGSAGAVGIDYINKLPKNIAENVRQFRLPPCTGCQFDRG
nr:Plug domain-containing protein [Bradyrhizobium canariense]